jgi:hypothetical protein
VDDSVLGRNVAHNVAGYVGQTEILAAVAIGQLGMLQAQQRQNCGVQIMNVDRLEAKVVGYSIGDAGPAICASTKVL